MEKEIKMKLKEIISNRVNKEHEEFTFINNCKSCKIRPEGRFCSHDCYYRTMFDYKSSFIKNALPIAVEYFGIKESQKDEFLQFAEELMELYY